MTARHNLFRKDQPNTLWGPKAILTSYGDLSGNLDAKSTVTLDLARKFKSQSLMEDRNRDVAVIPIATNVRGASPVVLTFEPFVEAKGVTITGAGWKGTKRFDQVLIGNDVFIFGYPIAIGLKHIPQIDDSRALLRKGIVAGVNKTKQTIVLDAASYGGNSGGPVIEVDRVGLRIRYLVIGLVTEYVPFKPHPNADFHNSGYSVAVPMDPVFDLLKKSGYQVE